MTRLWPAGEAVRTWGGEETPAGFAWHGTAHTVQSVANRWRVHTNWWHSQGPDPPGHPLATVWREYLKVTTDTGLLCLLYHDLPAGGWFLARIYD